MSNLVESTVFSIVAGERNNQLLGIMIDRDENVLQRIRCMEVENKEQIHSCKTEHLLRRFHQLKIGHVLIEYLMGFAKMNHVVVKIIQPLAFQISVVLQTPLTAAIMEAPAISFAREVNPFGMDELISHEIKISFSAACKREQPDHLVKRDGTVNDRIVGGFVHVRIHRSVSKPEDHSFRAN